MFSQPESKQISAKYTAVKIKGGNDLDDEGRSFMSRYGVNGYPTLLAMTAEGAVVNRSFERSTEGILSAMESATQANEEFLAEQAALAEKTDDESVRKLAGLYLERSQWEEARKGLDQLAGGAEPTIEDQLKLLEVVTRLEDADARKALLATLVDTRKDHERHLQWRMDLATAHLPTSITSREQYMEVMAQRVEPLQKLLAELEKPADQAVVRDALANALSSTGKMDEAGAHWDWILENARDSKAAGNALWIKARMLFPEAMKAGDVERAKKVQGMLQELVDKHPEHRFTRMARQAIPQVKGAIKQLEKKIADEAEKAGADDADPEKDEGEGDGDK